MRKKEGLSLWEANGRYISESIRAHIRYYLVPFTKLIATAHSTTPVYTTEILKNPVVLVFVKAQAKLAGLENYPMPEGVPKYADLT